MSCLIDNALFGRPLFDKNIDEPAAIHSFFKESHVISNLKPSVNDPNSLLDRIVNLFWKIVGFFINLPKPSLIKFESLIMDRSVSHSNSLKLFRKGLSNNEDHHVTTLFADGESFIKELKQLHHLQDPDQRIKKKLVIQEQIHKKIETLAEGNSLLLPATIKDEVNIFYYIQANAAGYSIKVIGCDGWMAKIGGDPTRKVGGKEKVFSQIAFKDVPKDVINTNTIQALFCEPLFESSFNTAAVKSHFEGMKEYRIDLSKRDELWVTRSSDSRKALSLLAQELAPIESKDSHQIKAARKRLEFQSKLIAFFEFYKKVRFELADNSSNAQALKKFISSIAKEATILGKKRLLSNEDLTEIQREIAFIEKTIVQANVSQTRSFEVNVQLPELKIAGDFFSVKVPTELPLRTVRLDHKIREPNLDEKIDYCQIKSTTVLEDILHSEVIETVIKTLESNLSSIREFANDERQKAAIVSSVMHIVQMIPYRFGDETSVWTNLTEDQVIRLQTHLVDLSQMLIVHRKTSPPTSIEMMTLLKLSLMVESLRHTIVQGHRGERWGSSSYKPFRDLIAKLFCQQKYDPYRAFIPHSFKRCFLQFDNEAYVMLNEILPNIWKNGQIIENASENRKKEALDLHLKQQDLFCSFVGITQRSYISSDDFADEVFSPERSQKMAKPISNPYLVAALRQMEMRGNLVNVVYKLSAENKFVGSITFNGNEPTYESRKWSENELREMQKDLDRSESLKMPEAASDNPQAVFDKQAEEYIERVKEAEEINSLGENAYTHDFRKEELSDLLNLLRGNYPQLDAVAFIKTHPHLLSNPDVRNFLDIVIFDPTGSSLTETYDKNFEFTLTLPDVLEEELNKYRELVKKDHSFYDQYLYILSLTRKFEASFKVYAKKLESENDQIYNKFGQAYEDLKRNLKIKTGFIRNTLQLEIPQEKLFSLANDHLYDVLYDEDLYKEVLQNPSLHAYQYRATVETLLNMLAQDSIDSSMTIKLIRLYHKFKTLKGDVRDIDPGDVELLNREYSLFATLLLSHFLPGKITKLFPLFDQICHDQGLELDHSNWKLLDNTYKFQNDQYQIDLVNGSITDLVTGGTLTSLPQSVVNHSAYLPTLRGIDIPSLVVRLTKKENVEVYCIQDKDGNRRRIEKEDDEYKFYHETPKGAYQVFALDGNDPAWKTLKCLGKDAIYFDPETPDVAMCMDHEFKEQFLLTLTRSSGQVKVNTVVDCRPKNKDSTLYQVNTLPEGTLKEIELFENRDNILCFSQNDKLRKVEFVRYGLSFTYKQGKLYCDDSKYHGYYIDLNATTNDKQGFPFALALRHEDGEMPLKLLLADPKVLKNKIVVQNKELKIIDGLWAMLQEVLGNASQPSMEEKAIFGPQCNEETQLNYRPITIRPYTGEILIADKEKISGLLHLLKQALLIDDCKLGIKPLKQTKLVLADLTKGNVDQLIKFLQMPHKGGEAASIKIQLALKLKELMGSRVRFSYATATLDSLIVKYCESYLMQGRKLDQQLSLDPAQFSLMAAVVQKVDKDFYERHVKIHFLFADEPIPTYSNEGTFDFTDYSGFNLDKRVSKLKMEGKLGIEHLPLHELELKLKYYNPHVEKLSLNDDGLPILFSEDEISSFFTASPITVPDVVLPKIEEDAPSCEKIALQKLNNEMEAYRNAVNGLNRYDVKQDQLNDLREKIKSAEKLAISHSIGKKAALDHLLQAEGDPVQNLAIKAGLQKVATLQELAIAFLQKDFSRLHNQKLLPEGLDINALCQALQEYFLAERKSTMLQKAQTILEKIENGLLSKSEKQNQSTLLYQLLSAKQFYSEKINPELLVYECFSQSTFRKIGEASHQMNLLKEIIENPKGAFQAITGAGKTTMASVLRALMKANGTNLVTFRLLPTLFEQSKAILEEQLGAAFGKTIYPLRFNLKTPLVIKERMDRGNNHIVEEETSLFKKMYHELLIAIEQKGCVLTDYKSIPLLQEKWIKLNKEFSERRAEGNSPAKIELEHWKYLKKILILIGEREETLMDEFDVPNRSCNRLQIPLYDPIELPEFFYNKSLRLFERLRDDPRLKLALDQQKEIPDNVRENVIHDLAREVVNYCVEEKPAFSESDKQHLYDYFIGKNDIILKKLNNATFLTSEEKDYIAFYKDQFTTFLPLTLKKASSLDYKRSSDGTRIVPCHDGEAQESSRFGHPLEEINYTIQDYIQHGVSYEEFKRWIYDLRDYAKKNPESCTPQAILSDIFKEGKFPLNQVTDEGLKSYLKELNKNWDSVKKFLVVKLRQLTVSGEVISMTPHDIAAMPKAVAGLSATLGCPEELPEAFNASKIKQQGVMGEMVYRLLDRVESTKPDEYDPEKPLEVLGKGKFEAVIDGAGAFRAYSTNEVAEAFRSKQQHLKRVGFYNESQKLDFVGKVDSTLPEKGFYFNKAKARGADIALDPEATAVLTVDKLKSLEDLAQNDGRMRLKGQKIRIARSINNPEINTCEDLIVQCARNEGNNHSVGLFRSKMQEIPSLVRQQALKQLLELDEVSDTLDKFEEWEELFIQPPAHLYEKNGDYFKRNKYLKTLKLAPLAALILAKQHWLGRAKDFNIKVGKLEKLTWPVEVIEKCPRLVAGLEDDQALGLELEEEVEVEMEEEVEMDVEVEREDEKELQFDQCGDVPYYPSWISKDPKEYQASEWLNKAFDPRIIFLENFLPLERKGSLYKRTPFDKAMPKVTNLHITLQKEHGSNKDKLIKIVIGDALDSVSHRGDNTITYDLRTRQCVDMPDTSLWDKWRKQELEYGSNEKTGEQMIKDLKKEYNYEKYTNRLSKENIEDFLNSKQFLTIQAQIRFLNGECEGYTDQEKAALKKWLSSLPNSEEMRTYFEKTILRVKPHKVEAFKKSQLYQIFDELK